MADAVFDNTKVVAYFLWEYTKCDNALSLWYCAEDLAAFFEKMGYINTVEVQSILRENLYDIRRVSFVRHIAFRVFVYTGNHNMLDNWYQAEALLNNNEWIVSLCGLAKIYRANKNDFSKLSVRSEQVKNYYN